jgi:hypothetical protein
MAMVQGAVHDALNAINRRYAAYYFEESGASGASPDAAVATAAHTVLVGVLLLTRSLAKRWNGKSTGCFALLCFVNLSAMAPLACSQNKPGSPILRCLASQKPGRGGSCPWWGAWISP